ncbi:hydroxyacylglutathione hydrolase [Pinirhizobacter sp.]|uniref:hydroxyacylglutathione hydrolase n=1 Tax=Pinirhizobacter sp. TaxID=2950432 RepID=UPI002F401645
MLDLLPEPIPALSDNYIWLLTDAAGNAAVVDPGDAGPVERVLAERGLTLRSILLTHHHPDHIAGVAALCQGRDVEVIAPVDERIPHADRRVGHGDIVNFSQPAAHFGVIAVPGHTTTHIAYAGEGLLFCGDTLFSLGCGRLFEGTPGQMLDSLNLLAALPDDTLVCCGHEYTQANARFALSIDGNNAGLKARAKEVDDKRLRGEPTVPSRMGTERATNPFLRTDSNAIVAWAAHKADAHDSVSRFAAVRRAKDDFR